MNDIPKEPTKPEVSIYCDGGCFPSNPGDVSAWGFVLHYGDVKKAGRGWMEETLTTSNRAEMRAAIRAIQSLKKPCKVTVYSDSQLLVNGGNKTQARGANRDLWGELDKVSMGHSIRYVWVRGHAGHAENEKCHGLVQEAIGAYMDEKKRPSAGGRDE